MDPWLCPCPAVAPRPGHLPSLGVRPPLCKMRFLFLTRLPRRHTPRSQWHTLLPFDSPAFSKFSPGQSCASGSPGLREEVTTSIPRPHSRPAGCEDVFLQLLGDSNMQPGRNKNISHYSMAILALGWEAQGGAWTGAWVRFWWWWPGKTFRKKWQMSTRNMESSWKN